MRFSRLFSSKLSLFYNRLFWACLLLIKTVFPGIFIILTFLGSTLYCFFTACLTIILLKAVSTLKT